MVRRLRGHSHQPKIRFGETAPYPNPIPLDSGAHICKDFKLTKVVGTANPADMLTKNLARADLEKHLEFSGLILSAGRADGSLHVDSVGVDCSSVGSRIAAALALAAGSYVMMDSSKVGLCPLRPRGGAHL